MYTIYVRNYRALSISPATRLVADGLPIPGQPFAGLLPRAVLQPSTPIGPVTAAAAESMGLPPTCLVCAGTSGTSLRIAAVHVLFCMDGGPLLCLLSPRVPRSGLLCCPDAGL